MNESFIFPEIVPTDLIEKDYDCVGDRLDRIELVTYIAEQKRRIREDKTWQYGNQNFKNDDGTPWEMSPGELDIFKAILFRKYPRIQVITCTQYGKSITIARGVLSRITTFPTNFMLVVPDTKRGRIIIRYILADTANNEYFANKLASIKLNEANRLLMRLLEEKSKVKLTYQILGEDDTPMYGSIEIITAEAHRKQDSITSIMGFGGRDIIADESALCDDDIDAGVHRMMAGKGEDTFLMKIGNSFFRNHFRKSWSDPRFKKIYIDYHVALAEGRYTQNFIDEALGKPMADVLYECRFPGADTADRDGWLPLITEEEIRIAMQPGAHFGEERLGGDIADEGTNESALIKRSTGYAEIPYAKAGIDPMAFTGVIVQEALKTTHKLVYVDRVGVGAGTYSRLLEVNRTDQKGALKITGVNSGEQAADPTKFANRRAEMSWRGREWLKTGGKLSNDKRWYQLAQIRYKANSRGQIQIMSKDEMRKRGIPSPDVADGYFLTFYDATTALPKMSDEERFFYRKMRENERKGLKNKDSRLAIGRPR